MGALAEWDIKTADFVKSATEPSHYPDEKLPQVAFAGRSNVGKSSLLNNLVRRKDLAKTSGRPGLTQLINFFRVNDRWFYVDLPGYGYARAPKREMKKWRVMIEQYLADNRSLRLVVVLMDARRNPSEMDDQLIEFLTHHEIPTQIVLTKCDKLKKMALMKAQKKIGEHYGYPDDLLPVPSSAQTGKGRDAVLKMLYAMIEGEEPGE